ncbi:hypothetical protein JNMOADIG_00007 [Aeromonas phage avDM5]|uniref:Uncharacterized protein n=1 Tax=Aeromonas phage vB_AehM_DM2 TaxID=2973716 RepID=A0AA95C867_9CAUD|nr:hypothetical protein JNMOADIG_00007 [Aeromonas phage avDM5]UYD60490.1 hypothetical protein NPHMPGLK_00155 [Aeromonas phage avDM2]UYD60674.1 hypothetical protein NHNEHLNL_00078 [Aeromonas phage avDM2]
MFEFVISAYWLGVSIAIIFVTINLTLMILTMMNCRAPTQKTIHQIQCWLSLLESGKPLFGKYAVP